MTVTAETAAWALEQMHRLETAVRELNEQKDNWGRHERVTKA